MILNSYDIIYIAISQVSNNGFHTGSMLLSLSQSKLAEQLGKPAWTVAPLCWLTVDTA